MISHKPLLLYFCLSVCMKKLIMKMGSATQSHRIYLSVPKDEFKEFEFQDHACEL